MNSQPSALQDQGVVSGAGFWIRALARIIDMVFGNLIGLFAGILGGIALAVFQMAGTLAPGWEQRIQGVSVAGFGFGLLGAFAYHSLCEGLHGASLGKLCCRLRVVTENGGPCGMKAAFLRSLAWHLDGLFFGLIAYASMQKSELKQRYGDVWAKTIVVKTKDAPAASRRSPALFFLGLFLGVACWTILTVFGLILKAF